MDYILRESLIFKLSSGYLTVIFDSISSRTMLKAWTRLPNKNYLEIMYNIILKVRKIRIWWIKKNILTSFGERKNFGFCLLTDLSFHGSSGK